jgi:hypothetical protein
VTRYVTHVIGQVVPSPANLQTVTRRRADALRNGAAVDGSGEVV